MVYTSMVNAIASRFSWPGIRLSYVSDIKLQLNFNGMNTFGTMKICSRQGVVRAIEGLFIEPGQKA